MNAWNWFGIVTTRNRPLTLRLTLDSLKQQTHAPKSIIVFDDGSTPPVKWSGATVLRCEDEGYDIHRVVKNLNLCFDHAQVDGSFSRCNSVLISADDCVYPSHYAEDCHKRMLDDPRTVIVSGSRGSLSAPNGWRPPEGSGRMIRIAFLKEIGGRLPEQAGYESWLIYEALRRGFKVACYNDLPYVHLDTIGSGHRFVEWAEAAWALGYDPIFFLARVAKLFLKKEIPRSQTMRMLLAYSKYHLVPPKHPMCRRFPEDLRRFVRQFQRNRIRAAIA